MNNFIIAGIEFMFGLGLVAVNSRGLKAIKCPVLLLALIGLYFAYFAIYASGRPGAISPYHLTKEFLGDLFPF